MNQFSSTAGVSHRRQAGTAPAGVHVGALFSCVCVVASVLLRSPPTSEPEGEHGGFSMIMETA
jgi:hypothetical protein